MSFEPQDVPARPQRLLVRGVNWLGDAVMTTPALLRLREAHPRARIALLTREKLADLWREHPAVDTVLVITEGDTLWTVARQLRRERFDAGLVLPNSLRAALEVWLAGIPQRIGYGGRGRNWLLSHALAPGPAFRKMRKRSPREVRRLVAGPPGAGAARGGAPAFAPAAHQIHHYLRLAAALGANPTPTPPRVVVSPEESEQVAARFGLPARAAQGSLLLALNAGAEYGPAKRWPRERFVATALAVHRATGCAWAILGGPGDAPLAADLETELRQALPAPQTGQPSSPGCVFNLASQTTLRQLCAVLRHCRLLLTNDTGPMHLAAAVGTPVVALFGSTSPELTGPGSPGDTAHRLLRADVPCAPCFLRTCPIDLRCLARLEPSQVTQAVLDLLERAKP